MSFLTITVGVGVICFLLLYLANTLEKQKHWILQLIIFFFIISAMLLIPKAAVDEQTVCEPVVDHTESIGAFVYYNYTDFCYSRTEGTAASFLQITQRLYYIMIGYAIVALAVVSLFWLRDSVKGKRKR